MLYAVQSSKPVQAKLSSLATWGQRGGQGVENLVHARQAFKISTVGFMELFAGKVGWRRLFGERDYLHMDPNWEPSDRECDFFAEHNFCRSQVTNQEEAALAAYSPTMQDLLEGQAS